MKQIVTWRPVHPDDMPATGQMVLVIQDPEKTATREPLFARFNGEKFVSYTEGDRAYGGTWVEITHWMPMPFTPKEIKEIPVDGWIRDRKPTINDASEDIGHGRYVWAYYPKIKKHSVRTLLWDFVAEHGLIWRPICKHPEIPTEFR